MGRREEEKNSGDDEEGHLSAPKAALIEQFRTHVKDTGSPEVQIALLSERVNLSSRPVCFVERASTCPDSVGAKGNDSCLKIHILPHPIASRWMSAAALSLSKLEKLPNRPTAPLWRAMAIPSCSLRLAWLPPPMTATSFPSPWTIARTPTLPEKSPAASSSVKAAPRRRKFSPPA